MTQPDHNQKFELASFTVLSDLLFGDNGSSEGVAAGAGKHVLQFVAGLKPDDWAAFLNLADVHHVTVRAIEALKRAATSQEHWELAEWLHARLASEYARISTAIESLDRICRILHDAGCSVTVIKSLDHWPDLGGDLDLFTTSDSQLVIRTFEHELGARLEPRSWGDRLAGTWNFQIPGLPELVEVHVKYLGQTGEHVALAHRVKARRVEKKVGRFVFPVPAPEERILIATLQRMYRHFYLRLCDIANIAKLLESKAVDFAELKRAADLGGIWPGVATLLTLVADHARNHGCSVDLPLDVIAASQFTGEHTYVSDHFLRIPIMPDAARLYTQQLIRTGANADLRALARLSLLPPLATAALLGKRLTGSDKGIW